MSADNYLLPLEESATARPEQVGGKALGLGKLLRFGLPVPPGFVVTADAYRACVRAAGISAQIADAVATATDSKKASTASQTIGRLFIDRVLLDELADEIARHYLGLGGDVADLPVAVRSSATAEDLADASFAGQQDTYLWICGADDVKRHIVRCWASLFTPRAIQYRARLGVPPEDLAMAVVVQQMVPAAAAGVLMTLEPVTGDREVIYLEGTYGLGEGVVRGDVDVDRHWVTKASNTLQHSEIGAKSRAHYIDLDSGVVHLDDVDEQLRSLSCLSEREVLDLAALGQRVERAFGAPMDIEWAMDDARRLYLVQARPETVWSRRSVPVPPSTPAAVEVAEPTLPPSLNEPWNPLHDCSPAQAHWTTTNVGEAMPGVLTPLSWSVWRPTGSALAELAYAIGALSKSERRTLGHPDGQPMRIFYGRAAFQLEFFALLGDRLPGTTGPQAAKSLLGRIPDDLQYQPTMKRYPSIAWRFPTTFVKVPKQVRDAAAESAAWYQHAIATIPDLDGAAALQLLIEARSRLVHLVTLQSTAVIAGLQPVYDALDALIAKAGVGDVATLSGSAGAEMMGVVGDLWKASRGDLNLQTVLREHGFHGYMEGELSSRVWREDPAPLERLLNEYARRPASDDPLMREEMRQDEAARLRPALLAALPAAQRPFARAVLALARRRLPMRGVVKVSLLQAFDVARAAARRIGAQLQSDGRLLDPEDVFYLTVDELIGTWPADARALVARRRERRAAYQLIDIPSDWTGTPPASVRNVDLDGDTVLSGIGVSAGTVEGVVRVVTDPSEELGSDEILVAPTTDPSWSSIMFVSKALVVDIGGALSHAAVVARELGIPCVVNTRTGTRSLGSGDVVRVDGKAGTVEVLKRASDAQEEGQHATQ
jgi:rifampicin phosphotransferase